MSIRFKLVSAMIIVCVLVLLLAVSIINITHEYVTSGTFTAPSYATYWGVLVEAYYESPLEDSTHFLTDQAREGEVVEEGFVGILLPDSYIDQILRSNTNYGQACFFNYGPDALDYEAETKTLTLHVRATSMNQDFLTWCQTQIPSKAELYVISATKTEDGFTIQYTREEWTVKTIFRSEE